MNQITVTMEVNSLDCIVTCVDLRVHLQQDLNPDDVFLLDAFDVVWVWVGEGCRADEELWSEKAAMVSICEVILMMCLSLMANCVEIHVSGEDIIETCGSQHTWPAVVIIAVQCI